MDTWYVSTNGNDAWSGRFPEPTADGTDGPVATLGRARDAARVRGTDPRRLIIRGGTYVLAESLVLTAADSGLMMEAAEGERVVVSGGRRLSGWRPDGDGFWAAPVPDAASRAWDFRVLSVNGRLCPRARWPHQGRLQHRTQCRVPWLCQFDYVGWEYPPTETDLTLLQYRVADLPAGLDFNNAELDIFHSWDESLVGVLSHDETTNTVTFRNPASYPPGAFEVYDYVVYNVREGLSEPGQWYLDRTRGVVVYWPLAGEEMDSAEVFAPGPDSLLAVAGTADAPVGGIALRGLNFILANAPLIAASFGASRLPSAVSFEHAHGCRLEDAEISMVAGHAVKAQTCSVLQVLNTHAHHIGGSGLYLEGSALRVEDCHVHDVGLIHPSGIGVVCSAPRLGEAQYATRPDGHVAGSRYAPRPAGHVVTHNEVHDTPYSGMVLSGDDAVIGYNLLYHVMGELADGAAIYLAGAKRCTLRGNHVHHLTGGRAVNSGYAYYLDHPCLDCLVEGNLAEDMPIPMNNHMSERNTLRHNVFTSSGECYLRFCRTAEYRVIGNVVHARGRIRLQNPGDVEVWADNIFFSGTGEFVDERWEDYRKLGAAPWTVPPGVLTTDPVFRNAAQGDYRFAADSPARALGLPELDVRGAGRRVKG